VLRRLHRSPFRPLFVTFVLAAILALLGTCFSAAFASTESGGQTVMFRQLTIGDGEEIHGDLDILFGSVVCEDGGQIDGNVHAVFGTFEQRDGCEVQGHVSRVFSGESDDSFAPWVSSSTDSDFSWQQIRVLRKLGWDVVVLVAFLLFPLRIRIALDRVEKHPALSFLAGCVAAVATIPIGILLLLSILGIPLIPLEIAALFAALWIGNAAVGLLIGRRLYELLRPHATPSPLGALVLGLVVLTAAETLPLVGWAVSSLVALVGLGAALLAFVSETSFQSFASPAAHYPPNVPPPSGPASPPPSAPPMNRTA